MIVTINAAMIRRTLILLWLECPNGSQTILPLRERQVELEDIPHPP